MTSSPAPTPPTPAPALSLPPWLPGAPIRASVCWVASLGSVLAFSLVYVAVGRVTGFDAIALVTLPAVVLGWLLGLRRGVGATVGLVVLANVLSYLLGFSGPLAFLAPFGAVGGAVTLALAAFAGVVRDMRDGALHTRQALERELERRGEVEAALQGSEERFRMLTEAALAGVYVMQPHRILYANPAFAEVFGYRPEELRARYRPADLVHPSDRDAVVAAIQARIDGTRVADHYRFRGLHRDGRTLQVEVLGRRVEFDGAPAVLGTLIDVTEKERVRDELETRLAALEAASNGIVITDRHGVIEWANPAFARLTGYAADEVVGATPQLLRSGRQDARFYASLWKTILDGRVWEGELINRRKDGSEYVEEMTIAPVRNDAGEIRRFVAIKRDVTERRRDQDAIRTLNRELERHVSRLTALRDIDRAIAGTAELQGTLHLLLDQAATQLHADAAAVWLYDAATSTLQRARGRALHRVPGLPSTSVALGEGAPGLVALRREPLLLSTPGDIERHFGTVAASAGAGLSGYVAVPLVAKGSLHGVLELYFREGRAPAEDDLAFLATLADQGALAADHARLFGHLERRNEDLRLAYDATIEGWARALDLRDEETEGHSRRVTELTMRLAERLGVHGEDLLHVRRGALLHDIGKMGVPDAILGKPGPLDDEEWARMREHPGYAFDLLSPIPFLHRALDIPYCHHEKWDGSGYPRGLRGTQIPLAARIFAIVDVYDALTNERPYRSAWSAEQALAHIERESGRHFDPDVTRAFLDLMRAEAPRATAGAAAGAGARAPGEGR